MAELSLADLAVPAKMAEGSLKPTEVGAPTFNQHVGRQQFPARAIYNSTGEFRFSLPI
jgi:hypothetical protein